MTQQDPHSEPPPQNRPASHPLQRVLRWVGFALYVWLIILCLGCLAGMIIVGGIQILFHLGTPDQWLSMIGRGAYFGSMYFGKIWGPGIAIVWCFVKAHQLNRDKQTLAQAFWWPLK